MTELSPRDRVYLLARTQNYWLPISNSTGAATLGGFADGADRDGRPLRWLTCPDCLANDVERARRDDPLFGVRMSCETCKGLGRIPDRNPDPMRIKSAGPQAFYGHDAQAKRDRQRANYAAELQLARNVAQREGRDDPEDTLERLRRIHSQDQRLGDYRLLQLAQHRLYRESPGQHFIWMRCTADGFPRAAHTELLLNRLADEMADWMLGAIAAERIGQWIVQGLAGIPAQRRRLRPGEISVPEGLVEPDMAGKGRWANTQSQGQRNGLIIALHAEGETAGTIARRVGLTKRRVQQLLADVTVATGPAAA